MTAAPAAASVHPTAIVDASAELGVGVVVGAYAVIGAGVVVGEGTTIGPHAVLEGPARLGARNVVHAGAVIGGAAQAKRARVDGGRLEIGDDNVFREHVTVHRGTGDGATRVGDRNLFMVGTHVAHDVCVGSDVTVANGVQLAGHVVVEDHATFGGLSGVAQHLRVGESAFVAAGAMCERDVPPFVVVQGDRARVRALNVVGLRRRGVDEARIARLGKVVRAAMTRGVPRATALASLPPDVLGDPWAARLVGALQNA